MESQIVGYGTESLVDGKINMKGIAFVKVDGESINLNEISGKGMTAGEDESCADQVLVWNATKSLYTTYAYYDEGEDGKTWYDVFGSTEPIFPAGTAFWYQSYATGDKNKDITIAGAVASESDITFDLVDGKINMVNNPYPCAFDLNDDSTVVLIDCLAGEDESCADQVLVWNATKSLYTTYAFYDEGEDGKTWYDVFGSSEPIIPGGTAFWYSCFKAEDGVKKQLKFLSPITK